MIHLFPTPFGVRLYPVSLAMPMTHPQHYPVYAMDPRHMCHPQPPPPPPPPQPHSAAPPPAPQGAPSLAPASAPLAAPRLTHPCPLTVDFGMVGRHTDNREEVLARSWRMERKRRREGLVTCDLEQFEELKVEGGVEANGDNEGEWLEGIGVEEGGWGIRRRGRPPPALRDRLSLAGSIGIVTDLVLPGLRLSTANRKEGGEVDALDALCVSDGESGDDAEDLEMEKILERVYTQGKEDLKAHARLESQQARQRTTNAWPAARGLHEQEAYWRRHNCA
ncbi:unnamed protein product [Discosporangium mesarthrocarpum]